MEMEQDLLLANVELGLSGLRVALVGFASW